MRDKELEKITYDCQLGMYFSKIIALQNGFIIFSDTVESPEWNFLFGFHAKNAKEFESVLSEARKVFEKINRKPHFVISPLCKISRKVKKYIFENFSKKGITSVMLARKIRAQHLSPKFYSFKKIDNKTERELFVKTFSTSKSQTLPDDVYEPLPKYFSEALLKSFDHESDWEFVHFLSLFKSQPVGMVSCCIKGSMCGLYGGGTYVKHRNKGVFSTLLKFVAAEMEKRNVKQYFLITERGTKNEALYNHLGFKEKFFTTLFNFD